MDEQNHELGFRRRLALVGATESGISTAFAFRLLVLFGVATWMSGDILVGAGIAMLLIAVAEALTLSVGYGTSNILGALFVRKDRTASWIATLAVVMSVIIAIGIAMLLFTLSPQLVSEFGVTLFAQHEAVTFLDTAVWFIPVAIGYQSLAAAFRSSGRSGIAAVSSGVCVATLVGAAVYLTSADVFGIGALAYAWGLGYVAGISVLILPLLLGRAGLKIHVGSWTEFEHVFETVRQGLPTSLESFVNVTGVAAFLWLASQHGADAFVACLIAICTASLFQIVSSYSAVTSSEAMLGPIQRGDYDQAEIAVRVVVIQSVKRSLIGALVMMGAAYPIAAIIVPPESFGIALAGLMFVAITLPFTAMNSSFAGALRGAGETRLPILMQMLCLVMVQLTLAAVLLLLDGSPMLLMGCVLARVVAETALSHWVFASRSWQWET